MNRRPSSILVLVTLMALSACAPYDRTAIAAERATHDWLAPEHARYVNADPTLDEPAKATRLRSLQAWGDRIAAQEQAAGIAPAGARQ